MARKPTPPEPPRNPQLTASRGDAAAKLAERIEKGSELLQRPVSSIEQLEQLDSDYERWDSYNKDLLGGLFTTNKYKNEYGWSGSAGAISMGGWGGPPTHAQRLKGRRDTISNKIGGLKSIIERLELVPLIDGLANQSIQSSGAPLDRKPTNRAFIVHGHNDAWRETIARFLSKLDVDPIILHEKASEGRTIVEKLEHYADVDFAVVLLTADDLGAERSKADKLQSRARQNVVLELGYFVGRLTRKKVCALYEEGVEMPSDYLGVGYVPLSGDWKLSLAKELKAAGFAVDMNKVIE